MLHTSADMLTVCVNLYCEFNHFCTFNDGLIQRKNNSGNILGRFHMKLFEWILYGWFQSLKLLHLSNVSCTSKGNALENVWRLEEHLTVLHKTKFQNGRWRKVRSSRCEVKTDQQNQFLSRNIGDVTKCSNSQRIPKKWTLTNLSVKWNIQRFVEVFPGQCSTRSERPSQGNSLSRSIQELWPPEDPQFPQTLPPATEYQIWRDFYLEEKDPHSPLNFPKDEKKNPKKKRIL